MVVPADVRNTCEVAAAVCAHPAAAPECPAVAEDRRGVLRMRLIQPVKTESESVLKTILLITACMSRMLCVFRD
jgi:hypothetical protein